MEKFFYRVSANETVFSVANKFDLPLCAIIKDNNLKKEIREGDLLYIERAGDIVYKVTPFDTVCSIAQKFGVKEKDILQKNGVPYIFYGLTIKI